MVHLAEDIAIVNGALGGLLLGMSATGFLFLTGNITGLSFITQSIFDKLGFSSISYHYPTDVQVQSPCQIKVIGNGLFHMLLLR